MKHNSRTFYHYLKLEGIKAFKLSDMEGYFREDYPKAYQIMNTLVRQEVITKLKNGFFAVNSIPGDKALPNWHLIAQAFMKPKPFYMAFATALEIHNLTTQPIHKEYIVSPLRIIPKAQLIHTIPIEVVTLSETKFFGFEAAWVTNYDKVMCSTIEKTIIDCIAYPQYAGGLEGIIKAIDMAKEKIKPNVLIDYALRYKTQAVSKRLGFLLEHMQLYVVEQRILHQNISAAYTKLDPSLNTSGTFHNMWRIEDNVGIEEIIRTIDS